MDLLVVRRGVVLALCLPVLLLGGCGDGDEESGPGPVTPSGSASSAESGSVEPSTGGSVPIEELPASEVEPEEFVRAWVEAYSRATLTGETTQVLALGSADCATCASLASSYEEVYTAGGSIEIDNDDEAVEVAEMTLAPGSSDATAQVDVVLRFNAGTTVKAQGTEPTPFPDSELSWEFYLAVVDGRWLITDIGI